MRGRLVEATWAYDPRIYAPPRFRKACRYEAFVPDSLRILPAIEPELAGTISAAEEAIRSLNAVARPGLQPLARLLLRTESIASSKVEGMQMDARSLARAEARSDLGESIGREAAEILANINAMQLAIEAAIGAPDLELEHILQTHAVLLADGARETPSEIRQVQNWIGGNDYNPCGAPFLTTRFLRSRKPRMRTRSSRPSIPSLTGTAGPVGRSYRCSFAGAASRRATFRRSAWFSRRTSSATFRASRRFATAAKTNGWRTLQSQRRELPSSQRVTLVTSRRSRRSGGRGSLRLESGPTRPPGRS